MTNSPTDARAARSIVVVTNGNYFSSVGLIPLLIWARSNARIEVIVTTGLRKPGRSRASEARRLLRTWGPRYFGYKAATYLLPALGALTTRRPVFVGDICQSLGIPQHRFRSVNSKAAIEQIRAASPDVLVSYSCPYRIKDETLASARIGCINFHSSLLPAYAGVCTYVHVLADGEASTGVTIHEMVSDFDAGKILAQVEIDIPMPTSVASLFMAQCVAAGPLLRDSVASALRTGALSGEPQDSSKRTYRSEPNSKDIEALVNRGHCLATTDDLFLLTRSPLASEELGIDPTIPRVLERRGYQPASPPESYRELARSGLGNPWSVQP